MPNAILRRQSLDHIDPLAVCADGTDAAYFWKPATKNSSLWVVDLFGGSWCWDQNSCSGRCPFATDNWVCSNKSYPPEIQENGIASDPELGANVAAVPYCSSDGHMGGDATAFGLKFQGRRILQAVLKDLVDRHGLASSSGHIVILSGQSAGGRGAMVNLDFIQGMVAAAGGSTEVGVVGMLDSPLWMDIPNYPNKGGTPLEVMAQGVFNIANVAPHLGPDCAAAYPGSEGWKCIFAQYRMPFIKTPYFLLDSPHDSYQVDLRMGGYPQGSAELSYALNYAEQKKSFMRQLHANQPQGASRQNAIYGWNCYKHAMTLQDQGWNQQNVRGITPSLAFRIFLGQEPQTDPARLNEWLDECDGFNCGTGCNSR